MEAMLATKRDLTQAIWGYCKICLKDPVKCAHKGCKLWPYRSAGAALQTDIFRTSDKDVFLEAVLKAAEGFGPEPFWWSELRDRVGLRPLHNNWYGVSTKVLKSHGFGMIEGARRSTHKSRCGAMDRRWKRYGLQATKY